MAKEGLTFYNEAVEKLLSGVW